MLLGLSCQSDRCEIIPGGTRVKDVIIVDKKGALLPCRADQNIYKQAVASLSNVDRKNGSLLEVIAGADAIIGVSGANTISVEMVKKMAPKAIVFAMANPTPEIMPDVAKSAGAAVVATGRSDFPNQINNVLAFPGIFRAVIQGRLTTITPQMKQAASDAIAALIPHPTVEHIVPDPFFPGLADLVSKAVLAVK
jgi:malate dehydrogenase (oxaloacetate-decarboxylating)